VDPAQGRGELTQAADGELASAAAAGDVEAFTQLVRRHESAVRAFLVRAGGREGADDLAQDTFLKAWRKASAYRAVGSYRGWLLRIAWTTLVSARRKTNLAVEETGLERGHQPGIHAQIDAARALAGLDLRERAAALLCFGYGHSHAEAADIMEVPLGTLKSIAARAKAKLALRLGESA
jgi:RNA polymerase sigma-70 factor (ECF subfamily)